MAATLPDSAQRYLARIEACLTLCFAQWQNQATDTAPQIAVLLESMAYSSLNGGKRLRASLVYLSANCCTGHNDSPAAPHPATVPTSLNELSACDIAATAIELIHCYSLVHDDLPAMDDDDLRRGKPTNHKIYGEAGAILAGDALQTLAFELMAQCGELDNSLRVQLIATLANASGALGMVGGQSIDLALTGTNGTLEQLTCMHQLKTGALISAATQLGARCADASTQQLQALADYGKAIGLAFQIQDDLLDLYGDSTLTGKQTGKDIAANKTTFPALLGEESTHKAGEAQLQLALQSLQPFDNKADPLRALAYYIVDRDR